MSGNLELVENSPDYWEFIRKLRNDPAVKGGFVTQSHILPEVHHHHMARHANEYYVCLCEGIPAGYVGSIDNDIRVATHPDFQGKGVGCFMINELTKIAPESYAKVKIDNPASLGLFEKCGFVKKYYILEKNSEA